MSKESLVARLHREIDEVRVQLALGRAEATDYLEEQKANLRTRVDQLKQQVESNPLISIETSAFLKGRLDELRLQLALGRMESRDAVAEQIPKITRAMDRVREGLAPVRETAGDAFLRVSDGYDETAQFFRGKLDAVGVALGVVEKPQPSLLEETDGGEEGALARRKRQLEERLEALSGRAKKAAHLAGDELERLGHEAQESFGRIRSELGEIFRGKPEA